jgi:hypothetical protein
MDIVTNSISNRASSIENQLTSTCCSSNWINLDMMKISHNYGEDLSNISLLTFRASKFLHTEEAILRYAGQKLKQPLASIESFT